MDLVKAAFIPWTAKRTNVSVLHELGKKPNLLNAVIKSKLDYFGHIARRDSESLEKQIMFGKVEGSRTRGRPKLRWTDGITLATGKSIYNCYTISQDRQKWRNLIRRVTSTQP